MVQYRTRWHNMEATFAAADTSHGTTQRPVYFEDGRGVQRAHEKMVAHLSNERGISHDSS